MELDPYHFVERWEVFRPNLEDDSDTLYRIAEKEVDSGLPGAGYCLYRISYPIEKATPCGVWINLDFDRKWVSNTATKRYVYPTTREALHSYIIRKHKHIAILKRQLDAAEKGLLLANNFDELVGPTID